METPLGINFDLIVIVFFIVVGVLLFLVFSDYQVIEMKKSFCVDNGGEFVTWYDGSFCDGRPFVCGETDCYFVNHSFEGGR